MIFNRWRRYPKRKPRKDGWYLCTVQHEFGRGMLVLYYDGRDRWENRSRQNVFDGYQVYKVCRVPNAETRVWTDGLCEPGNVVAWKKLPKGFRGKK